MSSLAYGLLTSKRVAAEKGKSQDEKPPGTKPYVDTFAALVPAEVLAVWAAVVLPNATKAQTGQDNKMATVISDPGLFKWSFYALLAVSAVLYLLGRIRNSSLEFADLGRVLIPPAAFAGWMLLQRPSVFDVLRPNWQLGARDVGAAIAALVLAGIASALAYKADSDPAKQK